MDLSMLFQRVGKVAAQNTPAILTALGVFGTFSTAVFAAKGAFKASEIIAEAEEHGTLTAVDGEEEIPVKFDDLPFKEKFELTWKCYIPAATSVALTVGAIVLSSNIMGSRNAALTAAYTTVERSYTEYRTKTIEKMGKKKEEELRAAIAQDKINQNPPQATSIIVTGRGDSLVMDGWSGRCFYSTKTDVDRAVNDFNSMVLRDGYGSLSDFWSFINLPPVDESNMIGWSADKLLAIDWVGAIAPDDQSALQFSFQVLPNPRFASAY